jgi:hypothetical protein
LVIQRESAASNTSGSLGLVVTVSQDTAAQSQILTLDTAETDLTVDVGIVPIESALPETPTNSQPLDEPEQGQDQGPEQGWSVFLPVVRIQQ